MGHDLGKRGRAIFCALFFGSELVLVATAGMRTDRSYGFRMFPETSTIALHLSRRLPDGTPSPPARSEMLLVYVLFIDRRASVRSDAAAAPA